MDRGRCGQLSPLASCSEQRNCFCSLTMLTIRFCWPERQCGDPRRDQCVTAYWHLGGSDSIPMPQICWASGRQDPTEAHSLTLLRAVFDPAVWESVLEGVWVTGCAHQLFLPHAKISPNDKRPKSKLQAWNNKDLLQKAAYKVDWAELMYLSHI